MDMTRMVLALVIGIIILVFLIIKTKIHTFLALILAALFIGIAGGVPSAKVIESITGGFGSTLGSIGIIIGFGIMMGQIFETSGAATRMAYTFIRLFGKEREEAALAVTGFLVSIPIFCDSGFVILSPLAKALSKQTKKSVISMGIALAGGLVITHSLVPPTPGPVGAAGIFKANVGSVILWGIVIAIPMMLAVLLYAKYMGKKIYQLPGDEEQEWIRPTNREALENEKMEFNYDNLPGTFRSFAPIIVPIILILLNTVSAALKVKGTLGTVLTFIGTPIVAVGAGLVIAIFTLTIGQDRDFVIKDMEKGIQSAGIIILVTGAGGALGQVLRDSGVGNYIAKYIAETPIPPIFLPFIIATLMRFIQGSGTVAMTTAASITAPIMIALNVNPVFATLSACIGSLFFSYFNDSFFWVVNRSLGITEAKEQIRIWSVTSTIAWAVGFVMLLIINFIFG
ncbi:GntP family permease [Miniphocaeibacter massiliensis]|uniref:GntP family permease n=1 Tax=Miniphocaeibacter massiliensis TaxID=2041841 RepID=UPI000C082077|nr:GntP family permease [Miniphocaeibacter massiliensis]